MYITGDCIYVDTQQIPNGQVRMRVARAAGPTLPETRC
jgi:hypothetical protein